MKSQYDVVILGAGHPPLGSARGSRADFGELAEIPLRHEALTRGLAIPGDWRGRQSRHARPRALPRARITASHRLHARQLAIKRFAWRINLSMHKLSSPMKSRYDVVILGAGHNGLVAATYLARAGLSVLLLEKNDYIGGATVSQQIFPDYDARLSRYSYLVSLFPQKIIHDLGLNLELRRRAIASCTPYMKHGHDGALLLSNVDEDVGRRSMIELTGSTTAYDELKRFYALPRVFAERVWDSMLEPLVSREEMARRFKGDEISREAWRTLVEEPLGNAIERYLRDDLVRGLVFTDAKVGVFTYPHDSSLLQNRCFLYHLIGNKTGEWKVPVGGMGTVSSELERAARKAGAEMLTNVHIHALNVTGQNTRGSISGERKRRDRRGAVSPG